MAQKKTAAKKSRAKSSAPSGSSMIERIVDAGLAEAAAVGWRHVTMEAVAVRAGVGLGEVLLEVPNKNAILIEYLRRVDARTLAPVKRIDPSDTPRDRLFEIVMRRFDALNENRDATRAVVMGVARDPAAVILALCTLERSFAAMLEAAGISTTGLIGLARIQGFKAVLACTLRAWMNDDSADLAKTMAALDKALGRAEKLAGFARRRPRPTAAAANS
jgi:AcrR family transcriptional regulator